MHVDCTERLNMNLKQKVNSNLDLYPGYTIPQGTCCDLVMMPLINSQDARDGKSLETEDQEDAQDKGCRRMQNTYR